MKVQHAASVSVATLPPPLSTAAKPNMDDRKRSLAADSEDAYPSKRHASSANGTLMRMSDPDKEKDIENFQKDAILRQMREYKRERNLLEAQLNDLTKRSKHYDDHLRVIDSWFAHLLDEIQLLSGTQVSEPTSNNDSFRSSLLFNDHQLFREHLDSRSAKIRNVISVLFTTLPAAAPEVKELQERLATLLAAEKVHIAENQRITAERDQLTERLEQASYRYLMAEKKMDRAKSAAVQKLESQAIMSSGNTDKSNTAESKAVKATDSSDTNGQLDAAASAASEAARKEAQAVSEKRKQQNDQLEAENKRLTEELTAARTRLASLTDEDYAKTDLFKLLKSQVDHSIKQRNDLEASVAQLREENQKFNAERTSFRTQIEEESRALQNDLEGQLARAETDLARIRTTRDELLADVNVRSSTQDQQNLTVEQTKELADASQHRIAALESELGRIRLQLGEDAPSTASALDDLDVEALKTKVRTLESQYSLLEKELPSMEAAWRKTQALATKKVAEMATWEEQRSRLLSEKSRADQKYWAAQKAKEAKESELRGYKAQNAKYSDSLAQLKDADASSRMLIVGLEKQLADSKESLAGLSHQNRSLQQRINEGTITLEALRTEVAALKKLFSEKDTAAQNANSAKRQAEVELEQLKVKFDDTKKSLESQKRKNTTKASSDGSDDWRRIAICPVCNSNIRNHMLKTCGHVFCHDCVDNLIKNRNRKCPSCGKAFGGGDHMPIHLA